MTVPALSVKQTGTPVPFNNQRFLHIYYEHISRNTNLKYEQQNELKLRCVQSSGGQKSGIQ